MAPTMHNILISVLAGVGSFRLDQQRSDDRPLAEVVPTPLSQTTITPAPTSAPVSSKALISALNLATNEEDRLSILVPDSSNISNITYHFVNNTVSPPTGGTIALSSVSSFPALLTTNVAMAIGFVNPCGLNAPHSHPRANEFLTVIQNELVTGLILESNPGSNGNVVGKAPVENANGTLPQAGTTLHLYQGTIYPQGSTHFQFNPTCEPSVFAAAFDNRDPGRVQIGKCSSILSTLHRWDINRITDVQRTSSEFL